MSSWPALFEDSGRFCMDECFKPQDFCSADLRSLRQFAKGSHSELFTGFLKGNKRKVVVKRLGRSSCYQKIAHREFYIEHDILSVLSHAHIIGYYGCGKFDDTGDGTQKPFLILERLKRGTLANILSTTKFSNTVLARSSILEIGRTLASALHYLHYEFDKDTMIIHRDVKPDNIGFTEAGVLKLMDFGLSIHVARDARKDHTYASCGRTGTYRYMAPEVMRNEPYNEKVDVYSFGIIMWQVVTLQRPFDDVTRHLTRHISVLHKRPSLAELPQDMSDIISSCWCPDFRERFTSEILYEMFTAMTLDDPIVGESPFKLPKITFGEYFSKKFSCLQI